MKELLEGINANIESFQKDSQLFLDKNNKAAGVRARKASLELEKQFKQFRKDSVK